MLDHYTTDENGKNWTLMRRTVHRTIDDGKDNKCKIYLNGEQVKSCFYFMASENPNDEIWGAVGRYVEPKTWDEEKQWIPMIFETGLVYWEPVD